jgi:arylsulfatase
MRVPGLMWWPGTIPAGATNHDIACTMDLFVTAAKLAGGKVPDDRPVDGHDLTATMTGKGPGPRDVMFYYRDTKLYAVRQGPWKAHFITRSAYGPDKPETHDPPLVYHLGRDPGEQFDQAKQRPNVVMRLKKLAEEHAAGMKPGEQQLEGRVKK